MTATQETQCTTRYASLRRPCAVLVAGVMAVGMSHLSPPVARAADPNPVLTLQPGVPSLSGQPRGRVFWQAISGDGHHLVYQSGADDLVLGDTNGLDDVFVTDLSAHSVTRASVTDAGAEIQTEPPGMPAFLGQPLWPSTSDDGRFVAFRHTSPDLVAGDSNGVADVFVRDLLLGHTERVSVSSSGEQGNDHSGYDFNGAGPLLQRGVTISGDGRFVAFYSLATNLVPEPLPECVDPGWPPQPPTDPGSPTANFDWLPVIPEVGEPVAFTDASTDPDGQIVAWSWDFGDGTTSNEQNPTHAFAEAGVATVTLFVTDDDGNQGAIFWRFRVGPLGAPVASFSYAPSVPYATSPATFTDYSFDYDGTVVGWSWDFGDGTTSSEQNPSHAFAAQGTYTVSLTVTDNDGLTDSWSRDIDVLPAQPAYPAACSWHLYIHDRVTGVAEVIRDGSGVIMAGESDVALSDDGRFIAFFGYRQIEPLKYEWGLYVKDRVTGSLEYAVDLADGGVTLFSFLSISGNGRYIVFSTGEPLDPVREHEPQPGYSPDDVYVYDRETRALELASVRASDGLAANGASISRVGPSISDDGRYVSFFSYAPDVIAPQLPACDPFLDCLTQAYVRDRVAGITYLVGQTTDGVVSNGFVGEPNISDDGCAAAYTSSATNLIPDPPALSTAYVARLNWPHCVGGVQLTKLVNGGVDLSQSWSFSLEGPGVSTSAATDSNSNVVTFGDALLAADEPYTLCERGIPPGWQATWMLDGSDASAEAYNPDVPEDLGNRCLELTTAAEHTVEVAVDNRPPPGGEARTIGYWKNWSSCDGHGNQADVLDQTLAAGSLAIGQLEVSACQSAVALLAKSSIDSGKRRANDAAYGLAAQLLAAKLNVVAGAGGCADATTAISQGQALLFDLGFDGTGSYLPPKTRAREARATALELAVVLDSYDNNTLC